jgi:hypothetical protein
MQRRDFLGVLGGAAAWLFAAQAQQSYRLRCFENFIRLMLAVCTRSGHVSTTGQYFAA